MKSIFPKAAFSLVFLAVIGLTACSSGGAGSTEIPEPTTAAPTRLATNEPESPTEASNTVRLAQDFLTTQMGLPIDAATVVSSEEMEWSDSCLGVGRPEESCAAMITPGWRIIFEIDGKNYEVRTDASGQVVRLVPDEAPVTPANGGDTATPETTPGALNPKLVGTQWALTGIGPTGSEQPPVGEADITIEFQTEADAGGNAGCNSYGSEYQVNGSSITFLNVLSTMMACTAPGVMDQEQGFLSALQSASRFELINNQLIIYYNDEQAALIFEAR